MEMVLVARETVVKYFKRFEVFILPILKFFLGWFVFSRILNIGHTHDMLEAFSEAMSPTMLTMLFALLFTVMPTNLSWLLIIFSITVQVSASIDVAIAVFVFLFLIFLFYGRMAVKESFLILFVILAYAFNIPYLIPLIVGLYFPVTAVVPVVIGVFINSQIPVMFELMGGEGVGVDFADMDIPDMLTELPAVFTESYSTIMESILSSRVWVFEAVIFAMVVIVVYFVSRQAIDYAKEIAIGLGCVMTIFGFILMTVATDVEMSILPMILWTLVCGLIALFIRLFDSILNYQKAESVQFEDDTNYYHVRIVPKVIMSKPRRDERVERVERERVERHPRPRPHARMEIDE